MVQAIWQGEVIAESDKTVVVEGNHYFPPGAVREGRLRPSKTTSVCSWKGDASYHDVVVGEQVNKDAAWTYTEPKAEAAQIKGYLAFWKGVDIK